MIRVRTPTPQGSPPPLPDVLSTAPAPSPREDGAYTEERAAASLRDHLAVLPAPLFPRLRFLRSGCYLLKYVPNSGFPWYHLDGTLRVERAGFNTIASGDWYIHVTWPFVFPPPPAVEPSPTQIPIFRRDRYRYYMRVTQILEFFTFSNSFTLGYELHRLDQSTNSWTNEGSFSALMSWTTPPAGHPSGSDYLTGDVKNASGSVIGKLTLAWVSPYLRRAVIEVDRVQQSEFPEESGYEDAGDDIDWRYVFDRVGWNVTVAESDTNLAEPSGEFWSDAELHQEMLARRASADLDTEWRYHLLCVRRLDSTSRGIMYDAFGGDSNNIPREGAAIASHWTIPDAPPWGLVRGLRFGAAEAPYFRTAVHEIGHAMGLYHNTGDNGFLNTTGVIAGNPGTFPDNVQWSFHPDDAKRLRHMPDPWVRPGMIPFGQPYGSAPISPNDMVADAEGLRLVVSPLRDSVPIGAPVRVELELRNEGDAPMRVPASLSLKSGNVSGSVTDPSGTPGTFWPLVRCVDEHETTELAPGASIHHSLTLLRGPDGALFSSPGSYGVTVDVDWDIGGIPVHLSGNASVMVTPPVDEDHAAVALKILSTPDALLTLALGGDHLDEGVAAIRAGVESDVLRPHYAIVEAKRVGKRFRKRAADVERACNLIDQDAVMSYAEVKRASELLKQQKKDKKTRAYYKKAVSAVKAKAAQAPKDADLEKAVKSL